MSDPEPLAYSVRETARLLSISPRHIYNLIDRGTIRSVRLGCRKLVPRIEIERILDQADQSSRSR
jgi:excisionase family DNA binding protein